MFSGVLSKISSLIWDTGSSQNEPMVQIPSGSLKIENKIKYQFADLTLVKGNPKSQPFSYSLIVRRLFDDEEEKSLSSEEYAGVTDFLIIDWSLFEMIFPLSVGMNFTRLKNHDGEKKGTICSPNIAAEYAFQWESNGSIVEFDVDMDVVKISTIELFHLTLAQSLYEVDHKQSYSLASEAEISQYLRTSERRGAKRNIIYEHSNQVYLYTYDIVSGLFVSATGNKEDMPPAISASIYLMDEYKYKLLITGLEEDKKVFYHQEIHPSDIVHADRSSISFIWCHLQDGISLTFSLKFTTESDLFTFSNVYARCIYEILNKERFSTINAKDESFLLGQAVPMDVDYPESGNEDESQSESESDEEECVPVKQPQRAEGVEKNRILALGYKSNRTFVSRGSSIGVFKYGTGDGRNLDFVTTIKNVKNPATGKAFTPSKLMLHDNDSNLILMNPSNDHSLFQLDLERGEVVEEWKIDEDARITNIIPESKYAQMTPEQTLIGINDNSIFRIDPRLSGLKKVTDECKQYVVKNEFACGATTASGHLAVASKKGDIRLYKDINKKAKTLLPGFGDPILGIDTTDDGRAVLATCKNYLLLINTDAGDDKNTGFTKPLGSEKPTPVRLQLKPEHAAYMGGTAVSFTEAHFSTGDAADRSIIASTGPYVITWSMKSIKQGKIYDYSIRKYSDVVVADNFKYGEDRNIIVTLPDQVAMISKKTLLSPKKLRSVASGIVDTPF